MFDKKYKKTLEILNDEIEMYHDLYHKWLELSESPTMSDESKKLHLDIADKYSEISIALSDLKTKIHREIES